MPYIAPAPSVQYGLTPTTVQGYGQIDLPTAFLNRLGYDWSVANHNINRGAGTTEDLTNQIFRRPVQQGYYSAYAGLEPFLERMRQKYQGQGAMNPMTARLGAIDQQYQQARRPGHVNTQEVNPQGQIIKQNIQSLPDLRQQRNAAIMANQRQERRLQGDMMKDLHQLNRIAQQQTISNFPVSVAASVGKPLRNY